jgi:RNA polymerase sigma-70 factor (ECF subfamily)
MADEIADDRLMARAKLGDTAAFATLLERHERNIQRYCLYVCRRPERALELTQDVFVRIWDQRQRYVADGRFKAWAFTIARNVCRKANARARIERLFVAEVPAPIDGDDGERRQLHGLTRTALMQLSARHREALVLRYVEDLAYADIAHALSLNESTARSRVHFALKALAELLPPEVRP